MSTRYYTDREMQFVYMSDVDEAQTITYRIPGTWSEDDIGPMAEEIASALFPACLDPQSEAATNPQAVVDRVVAEWRQ